MPSKGSLTTYHDGRLHDAAQQYGPHFEAFCELEKFDILAAIGLWGGYCAENGQISLAHYLREYCPINTNSDAYDMLLAISDCYPTARDAMGLISAVSSQISEGLWLVQQ